jgi:estrogen-related receptor beta like 1
MEATLDCLRILNYQRDFCQKYNLQPLTKTYFLNQSPNPDEQFHYTTFLASWLIIQSKKIQYEMPDKFADPNATIATLLGALKTLNIPFDHGPNSVKKGCGEPIIQLLTALTQKVMENLHFNFKKPVYKVEDFSDEAPVDTAAEVTTETIEERFNHGMHDDDDEDAGQLFLGPNFKNQGAGSKPGSSVSHTHSAGAKNSAKRTQETITSSTTPEQHRLELERVTPLLSAKINIINDNKDWRIHLQQMKHYYDGLKTYTDEKDGGNAMNNRLNGVAQEIEKGLEKISSREKYINTQFESQTEEYKTLQTLLSSLNSKHIESNATLTSLSNELSKSSEALDIIKSKMDDIGSGMTDSKPLINIKQGYSKLKQEIKQMDLRIGVVSHTLLEACIKNKDALINATGHALDVN